MEAVVNIIKAITEVVIFIQNCFNYMGLQLILSPVSSEPASSSQNCRHLGYLEIDWE